MAGIPDGAVDEVRAASDLVDVVSERVKLKKQGRRFLGLCPFHNEKSPSFSVDPGEGLYYCFGCRRGGDVFKFVQETEGVGFLDSVRLLADRAGIVLPEERGGEAASRTEALLAALRFAGRFYYQQLGTEAGERAVAYLRDRGFSREAILAFGIGVAPAAWDALATSGAAEGFTPDVLEAVGLVKSRERGEGVYDVFRDRLIFPILSPIGKVLGFGGRILPDSPTASDDYTPAKYINTPETEVYHKSRVLFGMKQAKRAIRAEEEVIVVEGYADVVSLWQAGVQHVVAASGTALTSAQVDLLRRLDVKRVLLVFDADGAGQNAARKGFDVVLDAGLAPYAVPLPEGADPDSFVRQFGGDAFRRLLVDERQDVVQFLVARARREGQFSTPEDKSAVGQDVLGALGRVTEPVLQSAYLRRASEALGVYEADLRRELDRHRRGGPRGTSGTSRRAEPPPPEFATPPPSAVIVRPEEEALLRLMLRNGAAMVEYVLSRMSVEEFTPGGARDAVEALLAQFEAGAVDTGPFVRGEHGEAVRGLVTRVLAERQAGSDNWGRVGVQTPELDTKPYDTAASAMQYLKLDRVQEALTAASRRVLAAEQAGEDATPIQVEMTALTDLRRQIEQGDFLDEASG